MKENDKENKLKKKLTCSYTEKLFWSPVIVFIHGEEQTVEEEYAKKLNLKYTKDFVIEEILHHYLLDHPDERANQYTLTSITLPASIKNSLPPRSAKGIKKTVPNVDFFTAPVVFPLTSVLPVALIRKPEIASGCKPVRGVLLGEFNKTVFFNALGVDFGGEIGVECREVTVDEKMVELKFKKAGKIPGLVPSMAKTVLFFKADFVLLFAEDLDEAGLLPNLKLAMENLPSAELYGISYEEKKVTFTPINRENAAEKLNAHVAYMHKKPVMIDPDRHCAFARTVLMQSAQLVLKPVVEEKKFAEAKSFLQKLSGRK